ncbi:MAG: HEAT repeat domain-containing protein [Spirochaetales bacterium]|nr:HEAT repeat domain-containing protein [Spirochaetales bacterium]
MKVIADFLRSLPAWIYAVAGGIALVLIIFVVVFIPRLRFKRKLYQVSDNPELADVLIRGQYDDATLLQRSGLVARTACRLQNNKLPEIIGIDDLWIRRLVQTRRASMMKRVLSFAPDKGLFACFAVTLEKPRLTPIFTEWLACARELLILRKVALSGKGENFDGKAALEVLTERKADLREMAGDPEWASRYFAVKIILHDSSERSTRVAWEAFDDPYPLVRKTVAAEFKGDDSEKMYAKLLHLLQDDPVFEVRKAARDRIAADYPQMYKIDIDILSPWQAQHVLEQLYANDKRDEDIALKFLPSDNLELRLTAALFLEKAKTLEKLFEANDFGDQAGLERHYSLLVNACEVNVTSFLDRVRKTENPASLLIASRLLVTYGDREIITYVADRLFSLPKEKKLSGEYFDTYQTILECISQRGGDLSLNLLERELHRYRDVPELLNVLLPAVPARADHILTEPLFSFLLDPDFVAAETLKKTMLKMPKHRLIPRLIRILWAGRSAYPHTVRIRAITLLGELGETYCLQILLENLPILPVEEGKEFSKLLSKYAGDAFDAKARQLLESAESSVRAALIASLPATGKDEFLSTIREALKDADPTVRIASIWSLLDYDDTRTVNQSFDMLRDPVPQVRMEAARAIGMCATSARIQNLRERVDDENETDAVKMAAIEGLGYSEDPSSVDALCDVYESTEHLRGEIERALARKTGRRQLERLAEIFKDAVPLLREGITRAAKGMREKGEQAMVALLEEDISSLKPYLAEILESTGYVESVIRRLTHRDPAVRGDAATVLSIMETPSAFRGIVLAARDPDKEVRVKVIKALEKLETEEGKMILNELENDPDKKVRKYTHWALERLRAKAL